MLHAIYFQNHAYIETIPVLGTNIRQISQCFLIDVPDDFPLVPLRFPPKLLPISIIALDSKSFRRHHGSATAAFRALDTGGNGQTSNCWGLKLGLIESIHPR